ncbi:hypothetical protein [Planctomicrobium sp. SH664]|uniref:hypothetical protein n=1 Tax=Planctomicrobium sp. SH664 TaxID=3448125 RepID=UPI003F5B2362
MSQFNDHTGRVWNLQFDRASIQRIRDQLSLDLSKPKPAAIGKLAKKPKLLLGALWCCCEPQAEERGITLEQFFELLARCETIEAAANSLIQAMGNFYRRRG